MTRPDIPVTISGDSSPFDATLARLRRLSGTTAGDIARSFSRLKGLAGGVAGLAGTLGVTTLITATQTAITSVNDLGRAARTAGVDFESFQELKYAAEQNLIGVDALTDGLKEMQLRADEFIKTGSGPAAESFARLGMDAKALSEGLKDPAKMFETIIDRVRKLDKAAQIRVLDELFGGTAAEQFSQLLNASARSIGDLREEGRAFGVVMNEEFLKTAEEAQRRFDVLATVVGTRLKSAIVSAVDSLYEFIDGYRAFENQQNSTLQSRQRDIAEQRLDLETQILELQDQQRQGAERLSDVAKNLGFEDSENANLAGFTGQIDARRKQLRELAAEDERITSILNNRLNAPRRDTARDWTPPDIPNKPPNSGSSRPDELQREIQQIRERTATLQAATDAQASVNPLLEDYGYAVEKAAAKQDLLNAAQKAGKDVTPELAQQIETLSTAYANAVVEAAKLEESQDRIREQADEAREFNKSLTRSIVDGWRQGKDAADLFADALSRIGERLLDFSLDSLFDSPSQGGVGFNPRSWLTGLFRERGGPVRKGQPYIVGEKRPEVFVPDQNGAILPEVPTEPRLLNSTAIEASRGSSTSNFNYAPVFNVTGTSEEIAQIRRQNAEFQRDFSANVLQTMRKARKTRDWP